MGWVVSATPYSREKKPVLILQGGEWAPDRSGWVRKFSPSPLGFDSRTAQLVAVAIQTQLYRSTYKGGNTLYS